jgi:DNA-binding IclR family transcriptional regulator
LFRIVSEDGERGLTLSHIAKNAGFKVSTARRLLGMGAANLSFFAFS